MTGVHWKDKDGAIGGDAHQRRHEWPIRRGTGGTAETAGEQSSDDYGYSKHVVFA
jgi:hypothetical protein